MRIPRFRVIAGLISGAAIIAGALVASAPASASPVLTPPPPSFVTCKMAGNQFICQGAATIPYGPSDTGFACGSGAGAFDIFDQGTIYYHTTRYYNTDGNQTKGVGYNLAVGQYSNPLTGAVVPYKQHDTVTAVLAVPGDFTSATATVVGENNFTVPGMGAVLLNAGRVVYGPDAVEFSAGPQQFNDYFEGNTAALDELCTALGAS